MSRSRHFGLPWKRAAWFSCLAIFCACAAVGQSDQIGQANRAKDSPLRQVLSNASRTYKIPGLAVAFVQGGQLRQIEVYGVRDQQSNAPVTANTIFPAGSLGEPVYAYAVLLLSAGGTFNPGAPLPNYSPLPYVRRLDALGPSPATQSEYNPYLNQVTALRVMNHSSGMADWSRNQPLGWLAPPGKKWSYSDEGYLYLQNVLEHVTGEDFSAFVERNIFRPAGMVRSAFIWRDAMAGDLATGSNPAGAAVNAPRYLRPAAGATLYTSVRDYAQFVRYILATAPAQRAHESAVSLMLNPTVKVDDPVSFSWGLGTGLEASGDDLFFFHRGNVPGFRSFVLASRKTGDAVIVFTNSDRGLETFPEIVAATLGGDHPVLKSAFLRGQ